MPAWRALGWPDVDQLTEAGTEAARLAADLIRIDTTNRGGGDASERPAAEYVAARLAEAGAEPVLLESAPGRANVVARISGSEPGEPALLLHGHLDVVPADPASWSVHPFFASRCPPSTRASGSWTGS